MICRYNENGNVLIGWYVGGDRYTFDGKKCQPENGWQQYDTTQDAWYFGVWVNLEQRQIVTFAEGDYSVVICPTQKNFAAELKSMADFYGDPPPAFVAFGTDGTRTDYYCTRPTVTP